MTHVQQKDPKQILSYSHSKEKLIEQEESCRRGSKDFLLTEYLEQSTKENDSQVESEMNGNTLIIPYHHSESLQQNELESSSPHESEDKWQLVLEKVPHYLDFCLPISLKKWIKGNKQQQQQEQQQVGVDNQCTSQLPQFIQNNKLTQHTYGEQLHDQDCNLKKQGEHIQDCSSSNELQEYEQQRHTTQSKKEYICKYSYCQQIFQDFTSLKKHQLNHTQKEFKCSNIGCGKSFVDNSKLIRHMYVHSGEKPFQCDICNKSFSLEFNLKTHNRTHTGEKPYVCKFSGCNKRFAQCSNLKAHERNHEKQS